MKKYLLSLAVLMALSLSACGGEAAPEQDGESASAGIPYPDEEFYLENADKNFDSRYDFSIIEKNDPPKHSSYSGGSYSKNYGSSTDPKYDPNDPYYSSNDHNHDGRLSDSEFQDAMADYLDDVVGDDYGNYDEYGQGYKYDSSDPYYSSNDHNHDGKMTDSEFQDAMSDFLDDAVGDDY